MENIFHFSSDEMENGMEWNGMENGMDLFFWSKVERKKNGMETDWKVEWKIFRQAKWNGKRMERKWNGKWNGKFFLGMSGMEKKWNGKWNGKGME